MNESPATPDPEDEMCEIDACDLCADDAHPEEITADEDLPVAEGGMA